MNSDERSAIRTTAVSLRQRVSGLTRVVRDGRISLDSGRRQDPLPAAPPARRTAHSEG